MKADEVVGHANRIMGISLQGGERRGADTSARVTNASACGCAE